jgi:riboflavin kinase/FMN adenylyltransferase
MKHFHNLTSVQLEKPSIVTIGNFDGVHRGHQKLVARQLARAHLQRTHAVVLTFFPHPKRVIRGTEGAFYLTTPDERAALLGDLGVDIVITHPFDESVRQTPATTFVDLLCKHLHMRDLWVGPDFALGYKRQGDVPFLTELGKERGYSVSVIDAILSDEHERYSSTAIREMLHEGSVAAAARDLGRYFKVSGEVVRGAQRGRKLGFPTANLAMWEELLLPAVGVYAGWVLIDGERFAAVTNVGVRPTFDNGQQTVEAHILDFDRDLYGQTIAFEFVARLRGEQRFDGVEALIRQVNADIASARALLSPAQTEGVQDAGTSRAP